MSTQATNKGMNHLGLVTHSIEETVDFYQHVLGFEPIAYYVREVNGGHLRQVFFDLGDGQSMEFAQAHDIGDIRNDYDPSINEGLGIGKSLGAGLIHFAFHTETLEELNARKESLESAGVAVLGPIDLDWVHSIYFTDPNGIQLEFACTQRFPPGEGYLDASQTELWHQLAS